MPEMKRCRAKATALYIVNSKLLIAKQNNSKVFGIPGGAIEPGETVEEALKRELKEETNLLLKKMTFWDSYITSIRTDGRPNVNIFFLVECDGEPRPTEEFSEFKWISHSDIEDPQLSNTIREMLEILHKKELID